MLGRGSVLEPDVAVGARARIQTDVYVTRGSVVEDKASVPAQILGVDSNFWNGEPIGKFRLAVVQRAGCLLPESRGS